MSKKPSHLITDNQINILKTYSHMIRGAESDYDAVLDRVGDAQFVLIGEASHGTQEFYQHRALLTRRLIREKGFCAVAAEADWPDAYQVNRYTRNMPLSGEAEVEALHSLSPQAASNETDRPASSNAFSLYTPSDIYAIDALSGFRRFPAWMWRNATMLEFVGWLREWNDGRTHGEDKVGFYGIDLYSLYSSIEAVLAYLDQVDSEAAQNARTRYACLDQFGDDPQTYGYAAAFGLSKDCQDEVVAQLKELLAKSSNFLLPDGPQAEDALFFAEQNARVIKNAEAYYRMMFAGAVESWNLRDQHMAEMLDRLVEFLQQRVFYPKVVVWAHNSHIGDARYTDRSRYGEWNIGQLVRERYPDNCVLIGFSTNTGTVTAASGWDAPTERKRIRPALPDSYEAFFHLSQQGDFYVLPQEHPELQSLLAQPRLQRAIGVIYQPETERVSHYYHVSLAKQFDVMIHLDETHAVEPLDHSSFWHGREASETFPSTF